MKISHQLIKTIKHQITYKSARILRGPLIGIHYSKFEKNFGDLLNPYIVEKVLNAKTIRVNSKYEYQNHLLAIGSILQHATELSHIWGSGFISNNSKVTAKPARILAVRGPMSADILSNQGIKTPQIYGDPALLLPKFHSTEVPKTHKIGIVPHYVDKEFIKQLELPDTMTFIDVQNSDPLKVVDSIRQCDVILSSSLHGLIVADAYGIANNWISISNKLTGGTFKFLDYYKSINHNNPIMHEIKSLDDLSRASQSAEKKAIELDLDILVNSLLLNTI